MAVVRGEVRAAESGLGAGEAVALGLAALAVAALWGIQILVVPQFAAMFEDFGGELPAITHAALRYVVAGGATAATIALAAIGTGLRLGRRRAFGWIALASAVAIPPLAIALLFVAMYAPIFELAGAISP